MEGKRGLSSYVDGPDNPSVVLKLIVSVVNFFFSGLATKFYTRVIYINTSNRDQFVISPKSVTVWETVSSCDTYRKGKDKLSLLLVDRTLRRPLGKRKLTDP